jgi:hypothetical protein
MNPFSIARQVNNKVVYNFVKRSSTLSTVLNVFLIVKSSKAFSNISGHGS